MSPRTVYVESDIPAGMTCAEYRRLRGTRRRRETRRSWLRFPRRRPR